MNADYDSGATGNSEPMDSASFLQRIPIELWNSILSEDQGFTVGDFKVLSFVAPLFRTICQPLVHKCLTVDKVKVFSRYSWSTLDAWKQEMMDAIRAERRLRFIGDNTSLSTFPNTMRIGTIADPHYRPPADRMVLSTAVYDAYLQFKCTLVQTLPCFTQLRRLEFSSLPIDDDLLKAIASHPTLCELKVIACSFPSPTFSIPTIRSLEYNGISIKDIPAALCLISPPHLQELSLDNMSTSTVGTTFRASSACTRLRRLTIALGRCNKLDLLGMESLLCCLPALRELDIFCDELILTQSWGEDDPNGAQAFKSSTIPYLQQLSSPISFARCLVPGRPIDHIQINHSGDPASGIRHYVSTWPELQKLLYPLCYSSATAEGITTLHLENYNVAPIWLLSQFVAETFPRLIDLRLPVGMVERYSERDAFEASPYPVAYCRGQSAPQKQVPETEEQFGDGEIEGMVKDIRKRVEYQLLGIFEDPDPYYLTTKPDISRIGRVRRDWSDTAIATAAMSMPKPNVAAILIELSADIELDNTRKPFIHPKNYQEALLYFAQGWYSLPLTIQTLSLKPGLFSSSPDSNYMFRDRANSETVEHDTCIALVTALGERYPSLGSVTLIGPTGYRCQKIRGMERGKTTWIAVENDLW